MSYKIFDEFVVRTALLTKNEYSQVFDDDYSITEKHIEEKLKNLIVKEAILVSSKKLYESLKYYKSKDSKKKRKALYSLNKYFIRMTSRATPYGLFGAIAYGTADQVSNIHSIDNSKYVKHVKVDMEWLLRVLSGLEMKQDVLEHLKLKWNPLAITSGAKVKLDYPSGWGIRFSTKSQSNIQRIIRNSNLLEYVKRESMDEVSYQVLINKTLLKVQELNSSISLEDIKKYINQLIQNEFILTDLRPKLTNSSPFEEAINILESISSLEELSLELKKINHLIIEYTLTPLGAGINQYEKIINSMESLCKSNNYLHVDLSIDKDEIKLDRAVLNQVEEALNFLKGILPHDTNRFTCLNQYLDLYIEEYGVHREVSLIELLDINKGLGSPYQLENYSLKKKNDYETKFINSLKAEIFNATRDAKQEICLNECSKLIADASNIERSKRANFSDNLELFVKVDFDNTTATNISLIPYSGSDKVGKSTGRFNYIFNEIKRGFNIVENDAADVEVSELIRKGRLLNVGVNINSKKYEIKLSTFSSNSDKDIDIRDLVVGIEESKMGERFYIRHMPSNKKLKFLSSNMLNYNNPTIYSDYARFLIETTLFHYDTPQHIFSLLDGMVDIPHIPAIKYKNVMLLSQRWLIRKSDIELDKEGPKNYALVEQLLQEFLKKWNIAQQIYIRDMDTSLLLNSKNKTHLRILIETLEKSVFDYCFISPANTFNTSTESGHENELVLFAINNQIKNDESIRNDKNSRKYISNLDSQRLFLPGDEWFYFKIYGAGIYLKDLITDDLYNFTNYLFKEGLIKNFHYVVYKDTESHLRVRFELEDSQQSDILFKEINLWSKRLLEKGFIKRIVFDTYVRELERYGGPNLIKDAEIFFNIDSQLCTKLLTTKAYSEKQLRLLMISNVINYLKKLGLNYREQKNLIASRFDYKGNRDIFNSLKLDLKGNIYDLVDIFKEKNESQDKIISKNDAFFHVYSDALRKLDIHEREALLMSLVHMHFNRMLINNVEEKKIMYLIRHTLVDFEYYFEDKIE